MKKLLLVDSDKDCSSALRKQLEFDKTYLVHQVTGYQELQELKEEKKTTDIILVNINKSQHDTVVLAEICDSFPVSQLIVLMPDDSFLKGVCKKLDSQKEIVLKPIKVSDLLTAISRKIALQNSGGKDLKIANYGFRRNEKVLINLDTEVRVRLTEKETDILWQLWQAPQNELSRQKLLSDVWGYNDEISSHTLETHIYRLRKKIENSSSEASILTTTENGYRLNLY
ncbi:MAG: winged helix-turn-helix domain-containing protein [Pseudomonadota bacterium]|nr:winged helix-turn-helix domain-containing protein [Pseudomonadota bacterium]MEC8750793.1 winged helix-turn-helix domain-containing protein [Pseudomonadota bacterium]GIR52966.1 MAG: DNA-binding response regulator [Rhodospirillaceae bacterium]